MMTTFMRVYGIGMAMIAFNPAMLIASNGPRNQTARIIQSVESEYDITNIVHDVENDTYSFTMDGYDVFVQLGVGSFSITASDGTLYGGEILLSSGVGTSVLGRITLEDENGNEETYSSVSDQDPEDEDVTLISVLSNSSDVIADYNWNSDKLFVSSYEERGASGHVEGAITKPLPLTTSIQRTHQAINPTTGSREIKFISILGVIIVLIVVAVIVYVVLECSCNYNPPPPPRPSVQACGSNPCGPGCEFHYGTCN